MDDHLANQIRELLGEFGDSDEPDDSNDSHDSIVTTTLQAIKIQSMVCSQLDGELLESNKFHLVVATIARLLERDWPVERLPEIAGFILYTGVLMGRNELSLPPLRKLMSKSDYEHALEMCQDCEHAVSLYCVLYVALLEE